MKQTAQTKDDGLKSLTVRADAGDADAMYELGKRYYHAHDVGTNYDQVHRWWLRAAEQGHVRAMFGLGVLYARGHGFQQDHLKACHWWQKAADLGDTQAIYNLHVLHEARQRSEPCPDESFRTRASDAPSFGGSGRTDRH